MYTMSTTLATAMAAGNPQRVLLEFADSNGNYGTSGSETFTNEHIVMSRGVHVNAPFCAEKELTIGMCPSAQVQFSLLNDVRQLSNFAFGECKVWIGARIDTGTPASGAKTATFTENGATVLYEFAPIGVFEVDRPDIVLTDTIEISAYDRMSKFDEELPDLGITYPTDLYTMAQTLCSFAGVPLGTARTGFMNADLAISKKPKEFENRTMREVLKWIAEASGSIARCDRYGNLVFVWFSTVLDSDSNTLTYDEHDYKEFTPCWYSVAAISGLKVRNQGETAESSYGTDSNAYVISGNPFLR